MTIDPERLDELLEKEPYVDDAGFTARVLDGLPPPRRDPRPLVLGLSAAAAAGTALLVLPGAVQAGLQALAAVALPAAVGPGLLVGAAAAVVAAAVVGLVVALEG
jgi:hypothetical protein